MPHAFHAINARFIYLQPTVSSYLPPKTPGLLLIFLCFDLYLKLSTLGSVRYIGGTTVVARVRVFE